MRGLGESDHAPPYAIADWVADAASFVREVVGAPTLRVGRSAGAWFGLAAAGRDPCVFRAFVGLDPLDPRVHVEHHKSTRATCSRARRLAHSIIRADRSTPTARQ